MSLALLILEGPGLQTASSQAFTFQAPDSSPPSTHVSCSLKYREKCGKRKTPSSTQSVSAGTSHPLVRASVSIPPEAMRRALGN